MQQPSSLLPFAVFTANRDSPVPLFRQLFAELRDAILAGRLKPGTRLPPTRKLAGDLGVSRNTVLGAYDQLLAEGYLEGAAGSGTFVASVLPEELLHVNPVRPPHAAVPKPRISLSHRGRQLVESMPDFGPADSSGLIAFRSSTPDLVSFPFDIWARLLNRYSRNPSLDLLGYDYPAGYPRLRQAIADYLNVARGVRCDAGQVIVVPGAQIAFDLVAQMLLDPGETVLMEEPGFFGASGTFARSGLRCAPIPIDAEGVSLAAIRANCDHARLLYLTPSHQFPLGVTMSLARRLELLEWARATNAWIVEDDYDGEFRYAGRPLPSLQGLGQGERVIYVGTFSKVTFPALRIGYLVVPRDLADDFIKARIMTDMQGATITQVVLADFIEQGHFARHIRRMRKLYLARQSCLVAAAKRELSGLLEVKANGSGMHLIGWLPPGVDDRMASAIARKHGVIASPLSAYGSSRGERGGLVLGYTAFNERQIRAGVRKLRVALSERG